MSGDREVYISVDVETSGPIPGRYSLLSIGACTVDGPERVFECELKPTSDEFDAAAMKVIGKTLADFERDGLAPEDAMIAFQQWLKTLVQRGERLVFVGLNAPFDWSFINYYFHTELEGNPFGFTALDIKAFYMGATGCLWSEATSNKMSKQLGSKLEGDHNPLHDAQYQADLFRLVRDLSAQT